MKLIFLLIYYIRESVNGQGASYRKLFESLIVSNSDIVISQQNSVSEIKIFNRHNICRIRRIA